MNFTNIISKIQTTLENVDRVEKIYNYATTKIEGFPAVVYLPVAHDNNYISTQENIIEHKFKLWVVIEIRNSISPNDAVIRYLAPTVDEIIEKFRDNWSFDNDGVIVNLSSSDWTTTEAEDGLLLQAELDLIIKSLDNLN